MSPFKPHFLKLPHDVVYNWVMKNLKAASYFKQSFQRFFPQILMLTQQVVCGASRGLYAEGSLKYRATAEKGLLWTDTRRCLFQKNFEKFQNFIFSNFFNKSGSKNFKKFELFFIIS
jgi:hypothetical protein